MREVLYLAGPMTGFPQFNRPAFREGAARLRAAGYRVIPPAEGWEQEIEDFEESSPDGDASMLTRDQVNAIILRNTEDVCDSQGIALLDGWEVSIGTLHEMTIALRRDIPVHQIDDWLALANGGKAQPVEINIERIGARHFCGEC